MWGERPYSKQMEPDQNGDGVIVPRKTLLEVQKYNMGESRSGV